MIHLLFILCALTSFACAVLLLRGYLRTRVRLLLWSSICFAGLTLNNALLVVDAHTHLTDLSQWRTLPALAGVMVLVYGLVWDSHT